MKLLPILSIALTVFATPALAEVKKTPVQPPASMKAAQKAPLLKVQMKMQNENRAFTSVSNVLKTRHDTVKNSISNVR
jgi:hypothetical protein